MPEAAGREIWLLLDAAGPEAVVGLVQDGTWLARKAHQGEFLEWFEGAVRDSLAETGLRLEDLAGALYASGPGSTLGLRLAAMFVRSLLAVPALDGWRCLQYQNLHLALAATASRHPGEPVAAVAPWRRDRLHLTELNGNNPLSFKDGRINPERAASDGLTGYILGKRPRNTLPGIHWHPYPVREIPAILARFPELLIPTRTPAPYLVEIPEFARWNQERHTAP